jgi:DNA-binding transcriptional LysR family regulator
MDLKQLAVLRAIADSGSFNIAANRLGLTQPAVSHQLRRLEEELGETLVLRRRPRASLSPAGATVLATAQRVLGEIEDLKQMFAPRSAGEVAGMVRVTASAMGIIYLYGELLARFIAEHQRIEVALTTVETPFDGIRKVAAREADAAFVAFPTPELNMAELVLGETDHCVLVAQKHPLAARASVSLADLRRHPMIRYKTGAGSRWLSDNMFLPRGGYPEIFLESNDTEFVKRVVALGFATAIVPSFILTRGARDRRLRRLPIRGTFTRQKYGIAYRPDSRGRSLAAFIEFCRRNKARVPS